MKSMPEEPKRKHGHVPMIPEVQPSAEAGYAALDGDGIPDPKATISEYLTSIIYMPHSMRMVCLTNLFCWMAHVCYSLYFTDFVGEAVYNGDPRVRKRHLL